jgi:hypothetical protein
LKPAIVTSGKRDINLAVALLSGPLEFPECMNTGTVSHEKRGGWGGKPEIHRVDPESGSTLRLL